MNRRQFLDVALLASLITLSAPAIAKGIEITTKQAEELFIAKLLQLMEPYSDIFEVRISKRVYHEELGSYYKHHIVLHINYHRIKENDIPIDTVKAGMRKLLLFIEETNTSYYIFVSQDVDKEFVLGILSPKQIAKIEKDHVHHYNCRTGNHKCYGYYNKTAKEFLAVHRRIIIEFR